MGRPPCEDDSAARAAVAPPRATEPLPPPGSEPVALPAADRSPAPAEPPVARGAAEEPPARDEVPPLPRPSPDRGVSLPALRRLPPPARGAAAAPAAPARGAVLPYEGVPPVPAFPVGLVAGTGPVAL